MGMGSRPRPRPDTTPSTGRPRLPISIDDAWRGGSRALPSPTSPTSSERSHLHLHLPSHSHDPWHPHSDRRSDPLASRASTRERDRPHLPSPSLRPWEDRFPQDRRSSRDDMVIAPTPTPPLTHLGGHMPMSAPLSTQPHHQHHPAHSSFWSHHGSISSVPTPVQLDADVPSTLPPRSLSTTDIPRNANGSKKQQSGRRRTACDRCKRQKSSCIEAYVEDESTGERRPNTDEKRCQRCVEKGVKDCIITTHGDSYARPRTPAPPSGSAQPHMHTRLASLPALPVIPTPSHLHPKSLTLPQHPPGHSAAMGSFDSLAGSLPHHDSVSASSQPDADLEGGQMFSPASAGQSGTGSTVASRETLFEEDASIRVNRHRETTPGSEGHRQGRVYFGNSHMGPAFVKDFVKNKTNDEGGPEGKIKREEKGEVKPPKLPKPSSSPRRKQPDYRAEKLLKHLPGSEDEMDRYVERFFNKYNCWADIMHQPDFQDMYTTFKRDHCFGPLANRTAADLRDLSLLFMVLAFGVVLDHVPSEEVARHNREILALVPEGEQRRKVQTHLREKDAGSMTLIRREEISWFWASLARTSLVDAQSTSMGETINSISAWVLVAWYAIHGRRAEEGWSVLGQAARQAMASGFHIDGSHRMFQTSEMPPKEQEQRRRLWAHMVIIDTSVSLYLGRPHAIFGGQQYTSQEPANIAGEQLHDPPPVNPELVDAAADRHPWQLDLSIYPFGVRGDPLDKPTRSTFLILHLRLAYVIGQMQLRCFGLKQRKHEKDVVECETMFEAWAQTLPPHFRMQDTDRSLDDMAGYEWLKHQRKNLHSKYYIARISLHRPYLLATEQRTATADAGTDTTADFGSLAPSQQQPQGEVNPYAMSRDACHVSALADLNLRTQTDESDPLDRFKWMTVASGFNSALVMGILCFSPAQNHRFKVEDLLQLLSRYLDVETRTIRKGPVLEEELKTLKFLHKSAKVHVKRGDRPADPVEAVMTRGRSRRIVELGESSSSSTVSGREAKRPRINGSLVTSTPLTNLVGLPGPLYANHVNTQQTYGDPLPLPPAHRASITPQTALGIDMHLSSSTSMPMMGHFGGLTYQPSGQYTNIPTHLQDSITDFASGDQSQMSFSDTAGLNTMHWQFDALRPPAQSFSSTALQFGVPHMMNTSTNTTSTAMLAPGLYPALADHALSGGTDSGISHTTGMYDPAVAAAWQGQPVNQILSSVNDASGQITISPDMPVGNLPTDFELQELFGPAIGGYGSGGVGGGEGGQASASTSTMGAGLALDLGVIGGAGGSRDLNQSENGGTGTATADSHVPHWPPTPRETAHSTSRG